MSRRLQSTGWTFARLSPLARLLVLVLLPVFPAGCGAVGLPFGSASLDHTMTQSLVKPVSATSTAATVTVDGSDWEAVRRTLATEFVAHRSGNVDWVNPDTGSSGTISSIQTVSTRAATCRYFATTLNDIRGVRRYRGEICQDKDRWRLTRIAPDDAALS